MAVRTDCLIHDVRSYVAGVAQDPGTVPSGEVWLVRAWYVENKSGVTSTISVLHVRSAATVRLSQDAIAGVNLVPHAGQFLALEAGDSIRVVASANASVGLAMYGSRLVV